MTAIVLLLRIKSSDLYIHRRAGVCVSDPISRAALRELAGKGYGLVGAVTEEGQLVVRTRHQTLSGRLNYDLRSFFARWEDDPDSILVLPAPTTILLREAQP